MSGSGTRSSGEIEKLIEDFPFRDFWLVFNKRDGKNPKGTSWFLKPKTLSSSLSNNSSKSQSKLIYDPENQSIKLILRADNETKSQVNNILSSLGYGISKGDGSDQTIKFILENILDLESQLLEFMETVNVGISGYWQKDLANKKVSKSEITSETSDQSFDDP